jgi:hypothetical protein
MCTSKRSKRFKNTSAFKLIQFDQQRNTQYLHPYYYRNIPEFLYKLQNLVELLSKALCLLYELDSPTIFLFQFRIIII